MRELSQHIRLEPVGSVVTDAFDVMADMPFSLDLVSEVDDDGVYWRADRQVVVDTPDAATLRFFSQERQCVVVVWDTRGTQYRLGRRTLPLRVRLSQGLQRATLSVAGILTRDPFG